MFLFLFLCILCIYNCLYIQVGVYEHMRLYICRLCMGIIICLSKHVGVRVLASLLYEYGQSC